MAKRPRRNHTAVFKAKVALEALKEERTVIEGPRSRASTPAWSPSGRSSCSGGHLTLFKKERTPEDGPSAKELSAKIGQLVMENDFLAGALGKLHGTSAKK